MIPKRTLQPIAENALYHGVKEKRGRSDITMRCYEQDEDVFITVMDDGIGMEEDRLQEIREAISTKERVGFGIAAVSERLELYLGEPYGIAIDSKRGEGTAVTIRIPKVASMKAEDVEEL